MRKYLIPILLLLLVAFGASAWAITFQGVLSGACDPKVPGGDIINETFDSNPGYDDGGWGAPVIGGACTFDPDDTTPPDGSKYCVESLKVSTTGTYIGCHIVYDFVDTDEVYVSFYINITTTSMTKEGNLLRVFEMHDDQPANIIEVFLRRMAGGTYKFRFFRSGQAANWYSSQVYLGNTYRIRIHLETAVGTEELQIYVDNEEVANWTGDAGTALDDIEIGINNADKTGTFYMENFQMDSTGFIW